MSYIVSSGVTSEGIVLEYDTMTVLDGGTARDTTISRWGGATVQSGGAASNTTVNSYGSVMVSSGGLVNSTTINTYGRVHVYSGGTANNTQVNSYGNLFVSGGTANYTTVDLYGNLHISSGGVANLTVINGELREEEYYNDYYGKTLKYTYYQSGCVYVSSGGALNNTTVKPYGCLEVSSGGTATAAMVEANAMLCVSSGGTATGIVASAGAKLDLAVSPDTYVQMTYDGAALAVKNGVLSGITTIASGNSVNVCSGGSVSGITVDEGGRLLVRSGGFAAGIRTSEFFNNYYYEEDLDSGYWLERGALFSDCVISGAVLQSEGFATVLSGMTAINPTVSGGGLVISSGGVATNVVWTPCIGSVYVEDGANVTFASKYSGVYYRSNGSVVNTELVNGLICSGDEESVMVYVMSGGTAVHTILGTCGYLFVNSGGTANDSLLNGGLLEVSSCGVVNRTLVSGGWDEYDEYVFRGELCISNGGVAYDTIVAGYGELSISSGGIANNTVLSGIDAEYVDEDGDWRRRREIASMFVSSGGTAADTMIENGLVIISGGGVLSNFTLNNASGYSSSVTTVVYDYDEGWSSTFRTPGIHVSAGVKLTGRMTFLNGAKVFASTGAILDFDLTQTRAGADALVNDLSVIDGPLSYTITVDGTQAAGTYRLADGISIFTSVIAVMNDTGRQVGALLVGQTFTYGNADYTLNMDDNGLAISVRTIGAAPVADGPKVLSVEADITDPTNMDVLVTATFSEDSAVRQYSLDGENWGVYPGGVLFGTNKTVFFRSIDAAGNISEVASYEVTNIDRTAPGKPVATADVTTPTTRNVLVTATFDEDSVEKEYSLDGETWQEYTDGVLCTKNETLSFRGIDVAGNASEIMRLVVDNIVDVEVDDGPDKGGNNTLLKDGKVNPDIAAENEVKEDSDELFVDVEGSVAVKVGGTEYHNCVGREDPVDFAKITLASTAKLGFSFDATDKIKMTLYRIVDGKKGAAMKSLGSTSLSKAGKKDSKPVLLEAGEYYIGVENKNKKSEATFYNVDLNDDCIFYADCDNGDNNWLYDSKAKVWNDKVTGAAAIVLDEAAIGQNIQLDDYVPSMAGYENFVGFGDAMDIRKVVLDNAAMLRFQVSLTGGSGKFAVYYQDAKGKMATVNDLTTTFKMSGSTKKAAVLSAGTYYLAFQSANAKKGDAVYYTVKLGSGSVIYSDGDSGANDYDSKAKKVSDAVRTTIASLEPGKTLQFDGVLDADAGLEIAANGYTNFVGTGDVSDVLRVNAAVGDTLSLRVSATDSVNLVLYGLKNGKVTALKTVKAKKGDGTLNWTFKAKDGTEFFVGVEAANAKKGSAAYYNVEVVSFSGSFADALAMPETDALAMTDALSFGQLNADALADAAAFDKLASFDAASAWQTVAKLA